MNQRVQIIDGKLQTGDPDRLLEWVVRRPNGEPAEIGYYAGSAYVSGNKLNVARGVHLEEFIVDSKPTPESVQRDAGYRHGMKQKRHIWPGKRADESADYADGWGLAWSERRRVEDNKKRWADEDKQAEAGKSRSNPGSRRKTAKSMTKPAKKTARKNPAPKRKAATHYVTKPGRGGTLYLWDVKVTPADPGHAPYHIKMWSADIDLLFDRLVYDDMLAGDHWEIVGRVKQSLTDQGPRANPARQRKNPADIVKTIKAAIPKGYSVRHYVRGSLSGTVSVYPPVALDTKEWCEVSRKLRRMFPGVDFGGSLAAEPFCAYHLDYSPSEQERHLEKIGARLARIPALATEHLSSSQALDILTRAGRRNPSARRKPARRTKKATR